MVDQNANAPASVPSKPQGSGTSAKDHALSQPSVIHAGETMLIISLVLILLVCCVVSLHLWLRQRRRRGKKTKKKKKGEEKGQEQQQAEIASREKKVVEIVGVPMCEMGESEVRYEMGSGDGRSAIGEEGVEIQQNGHLRERDVDVEAGDGVDISWYDDSEERVEPRTRELAMYWSRGI